MSERPLPAAVAVLGEGFSGRPLIRLPPAAGSN